MTLLLKVSNVNMCLIRYSSPSCMKRWTDLVWDHCLTLEGERKEKKKESSVHFRALKNMVVVNYPIPYCQVLAFSLEWEDYNYSPTFIDTLSLRKKERPVLGGVCASSSCHSAVLYFCILHQSCISKREFFIDNTSRESLRTALWSYFLF